MRMLEGGRWGVETCAYDAPPSPSPSPPPPITPVSSSLMRTAPHPHAGAACTQRRSAPDSLHTRHCSVTAPRHCTGPASWPGTGRWLGGREGRGGHRSGQLAWNREVVRGGGGEGGSQV